MMPIAKMKQLTMYSAYIYELKMQTTFIIHKGNCPPTAMDAHDHGFFDVRI